MLEQPLLRRVSRFLLGVGVGAITTLYFVRAGLVTRDVSLLPLVYFLVLIVTAALLGQATRADRERQAPLPEPGVVLARWTDRKWVAPQPPAPRSQALRGGRGRGGA
jgi:hypothetical protein